MKSKPNLIRALLENQRRYPSAAKIAEPRPESKRNTLAELEKLVRAAISEDDQHTRETDELLVAIRAAWARLELNEMLVRRYEEYVASHIASGARATARFANALMGIKDYSPALSARPQK